MKNKLGLITIIAFICGILFGIFFKDYSSAIAFIGTYYIKLLKVIITPILFTSISLTIFNTKKKKNHIIGKTLALFTALFVSTFLITSILVLIINPSKGYVVKEVEWTGAVTSFELRSFLINLLPKNFSDLFINPKVFFIIAFSCLFGLVIKSEKVFSGIEKVKNYIFKFLEYVMYITPLAIFSLMATIVSDYGSILFGVGIKYILTAYFCSVVCLLLVMILPVTIKCHISPIVYIKKVYKIWIMTITTCSSSAVLPYTIKTCNEEFNVPKEITDVVVPLGCTIHMCGGAVSFALLGIFCASIYGIEINIGTYLLMLISSLLINMAAPGIPNGGVVIGATFLNMFGIPLNFIGFYAGIYKLLDMVYTTLNVTGDISANVLIYSIINKQDTL